MSEITAVSQAIRAAWESVERGGGEGGTWSDAAQATRTPATQHAGVRPAMKKKKKNACPAEHTAVLHSHLV